MALCTLPCADPADAGWRCNAPRKAWRQWNVVASNDEATTMRHGSLAFASDLAGCGGLRECASACVRARGALDSMPGLKIARDVSGSLCSRTVAAAAADTRYRICLELARFACFLMNFVIVRRKIAPAAVNSPVSGSPGSRTIKGGSCESPRDALQKWQKRNDEASGFS